MSYFPYPQQLLSSIKSREPEVEEVTEHAQALTSMTSEPRVTSHVAQISNRYQTLLNSTKVSGEVVSLGNFE